MVHNWDSHPPSPAHDHIGAWDGYQQHHTITTTTTIAPPSSSAPATYSSLSVRRRSSAAVMPPAVPPPTQPIPNVPPLPPSASVSNSPSTSSILVNATATTTSSPSSSASPFESAVGSEYYSVYSDTVDHHPYRQSVAASITPTAPAVMTAPGTSAAYGRPVASTKLAAVAAFSQNQNRISPGATTATTSTGPTTTAPAISASATTKAAANGHTRSGYNSATSSSSSPDTLSDPPPRSILHSHSMSTESSSPPSSSSSQAAAQQQQLSQRQRLSVQPVDQLDHHTIVPNKLLLSPSDASSPPNKPSPRRALTKALELAREAVKLDTNNNDPAAAVKAYGRSVALLSDVMERVRRGEHSTDSGRRNNGRRRSVVAQEEEIRRLKSIHDTYADRMNILSLMFEIPLSVPPSPTSEYTLSSISVSTTESVPHSPPATSSPSSESSAPSPIGSNYRTSGHPASEDRSSPPVHEGPAEAVTSNSTQNYNRLSHSYPIHPHHHHSQHQASPPPGPPTSYHPYAAPERPERHSLVPPATSTQPGRPRTMSAVGGRSRSGSIAALPPQAPPPSTAPPPPPPMHHLPSEPISISSSSSSSSGDHLLPPVYHHASETASRALAGANTHRRTPSGSRLAALPEENEPVQRQQHQRTSQSSDREMMLKRNRDSPSLPPTPQYTSHRDSHPLPPLPSPSASSISSASSMSTTVTPRNPDPRSPPVPGSAVATATTPSYTRARGGTLPSAAVEVEGLSVPAHGSSSVHAPPRINASTQMATIIQRRAHALSTSSPPGAGGVSMSAPVSLTSSPTTSPHVPAAIAAQQEQPLPPPPSSSAITGRSRSNSQPGRRPSIVGGGSASTEVRPPLPSQPASFTAASGSSTIILNGQRKASIPSKLNPAAAPSLPQLVIQPEMLSPTSTSLLLSAKSLAPQPPIASIDVTGISTPASPLPAMPPSEVLLRPYYLMRVLHNTMTSKTGGYVTKRLHVPPDTWTQGGAKLVNIPEKIRALDVLASSLASVVVASAECFGPGDVSTGMALGIGSIGRKDAEMWLDKLDDFQAACADVVQNFGKKLGVGEGYVLKKATGVTSWSGRLGRQFDKFTKDKSLDSPADYVKFLQKLFDQAQLLEEHTRALLSSPIAPSYAAVPKDIRDACEDRLRQASDFFAKVVVTFVLRDLSLLLDKFVKRCEKWLAE